MKLFNFICRWKDIPEVKSKDSTEYIFDDIFWETIDIILNYIDFYEFLKPDMKDKITVTCDSTSPVEGISNAIHSIIISNDILDDVNPEIEGNLDRVFNRANSRRPGYCIRGKRLTEEQAFDVLIHSDEVFHKYLERLRYIHENNDLPENSLLIKSIHTMENLIDNHNIILPLNRHIGNKYIQGRGYTWSAGFVLPDGTVGCNHWAYKYPEHHEILMDALMFAKRFSFMEFCIAVTSWNEICSELWDHKGVLSEEEKDFYDITESLKRDFEYCLYVHDGKVEVLNTLDKYFEFDSMYKDKRVFYTDDYWRKIQKSCVYTKEYLVKMLSYYGFEESDMFYKYCMSSWDYITRFYREGKF